MPKLLPRLPREDRPDNNRYVDHAGDKTENAPLWLTNHARNYSESPLYRLPYDVAVLIYARLDDTTKRVLRQTSALYREGSVPSAKTLEKEKLNMPIKHLFCTSAFNGRQLGPVYAPPTDANELHALNELLRRDSVGYCAACREFRASGGFATALHRVRFSPPLWCSGCETTHTQLLFSAAQQALKNDRSRICIGRQGRMEMCLRGVGYTWPGVTQSLREVSPKDVSCNRWRHWTPPQCLVVGQVLLTVMNLGRPPAARFFRFNNDSFTDLGVHLFDHFPWSRRMTPRRLAARLAVALTPTELKPNTSRMFPRVRSRGGALSTLRFCPHVEAGDVQKLLMLPFMASQ